MPRNRKFYQHVWFWLVIALVMLIGYHLYTVNKKNKQIAYAEQELAAEKQNVYKFNAVTDALDSLGRQYAGLESNLAFTQTQLDSVTGRLETSLRLIKSKYQHHYNEVYNTPDSALGNLFLRAIAANKAVRSKRGN
jgi:hypothetical protein